MVGQESNWADMAKPNNSTGVSGPLWYAAGATVQILLFATVAIELKRRAPNAHVSHLN